MRNCPHSSTNSPQPLSPQENRAPGSHSFTIAMSLVLALGRNLSAGLSRSSALSECSHSHSWSWGTSQLWLRKISKRSEIWALFIIIWGFVLTFHWDEVLKIFLVLLCKALQRSCRKGTRSSSAACRLPNHHLPKLPQSGRAGFQTQAAIPSMVSGMEHQKPQQDVIIVMVQDEFPWQCNAGYQVLVGSKSLWGCCPLAQVSN